MSVNIQGRSVLSTREIQEVSAELQTLRQEKEAQYDCHGGPGTTQEACGACVTCLHRIIDTLIADRDNWQRACEAARAELQTTTFALEQVMEAVEELAKGQTDVIDLLVACLAQGEALPESLRQQIQALLAGAVVVKEQGSHLVAEPLMPPEPGPFQ